jgi:hypothetical protein
MQSSAKNAAVDQNLSLLLQQALTADKDELFSVIQTTQPEVLLATLRNPHLDDKHLLTILKQRGLPEELFSALYSSKRCMDNQQVVFALVCHPETPSHIALTLLPHLSIFDLIKICQILSVSPDLRMAAERTIIQRLPAQPLGNKLTLARRGTAAVVDALLKEGTPPLVEACLENPHLKEGSVHQFITSATSTAETISIVGRSSRWKGRPNIRLAILKNPRTPAIWFTMFLPGLPQNTVRDLLSVPRLTSAQKDLVRQALGNRRHPA